MTRFFVGLHHPSNAWPFLNSMISANTLVGRQSDFRANNWIMDSGAFSQISRYGRFTISMNRYVETIERFRKCGTLVAAVAQDWMCEPFILKRTGLSVKEHQERTMNSYLCLSLMTQVAILPVLQGFKPTDYVDHVRMYGGFLRDGQWVGVGSVCKRNGNPDAIEDVLLAIKQERPDLRLHGFGLKLQALERPTIRELLDSSDSMAWSFADRYEGGNGHDPRVALQYCADVEKLIGHPTFIQNQLFQWWQ